VSTAEAYAAIDTITRLHTGGHHCLTPDGTTAWFNENAGARSRCPTRTLLTGVRDEITSLTQQVHTAAHDPDAVRATAEGMTGLVMADLGGDDREGWTQTARDAIEALAAHLDPTTRQETPDAY
jgi:hypothetical protein